MTTINTEELEEQEIERSLKNKDNDEKKIYTKNDLNNHLNEIKNVLREKERDLSLAAEIGQQLLEANTVLKKAYEELFAQNQESKRKLNRYEQLKIVSSGRSSPVQSNSRPLSPRFNAMRSRTNSPTSKRGSRNLSLPPSVRLDSTYTLKDSSDSESDESLSGNQKEQYISKIKTLELSISILGKQNEELKLLLEKRKDEIKDIQIQNNKILLIKDGEVYDLKQDLEALIQKNQSLEREKKLLSKENQKQAIEINKIEMVDQEYIQELLVKINKLEFSLKKMENTKNELEKNIENVMNQKSEYENKCKNFDKQLQEFQYYKQLHDRQAQHIKELNQTIEQQRQQIQSLDFQLYNSSIDQISLNELNSNDFGNNYIKEKGSELQIIQENKQSSDLSIENVSNSTDSLVILSNSSSSSNSAMTSNSNLMYSSSSLIKKSLHSELEQTDWYNSTSNDYEKSNIENDNNQLLKDSFNNITKNKHQELKNINKNEKKNINSNDNNINKKIDNIDNTKNKLNTNTVNKTKINSQNSNTISKITNPNSLALIKHSNIPLFNFKKLSRLENSKIENNLINNNVNQNTGLISYNPRKKMSFESIYKAIETSKTSNDKETTNSVINKNTNNEKNNNLFRNSMVGLSSNLDLFNSIGNSSMIPKPTHFLQNSNLRVRKNSLLNENGLQNFGNENILKSIKNIGVTSLNSNENENEINLDIDLSPTTILPMTSSIISASSSTSEELKKSQEINTSNKLNGLLTKFHLSSSMTPLLTNINKKKDDSQSIENTQTKSSNRSKIKSRSLSAIDISNTKTNNHFSLKNKPLFSSITKPLAQMDLSLIYDESLPKCFDDSTLSDSESSEKNVNVNNKNNNNNKPISSSKSSNDTTTLNNTFEINNNNNNDITEKIPMTTSPTSESTFSPLPSSSILSSSVLTNNQFMLDQYKNTLNHYSTSGSAILQVLLDSWLRFLNGFVGYGTSPFNCEIPNMNYRNSSFSEESYNTSSSSSTSSSGSATPNHTSTSNIKTLSQSILKRK